MADAVKTLYEAVLAQQENIDELNMEIPQPIITHKGQPVDGSSVRSFERRSFRGFKKALEGYGLKKKECEETATQKEHISTKYNSLYVLYKKQEEENIKLSVQLGKERKEKQEVETRLQLLVSNFERLADDAVCSGDTVFDTKEVKVHAHGCIVGLWSTPFRMMLQSEMKEGITKSVSIATEEPEHVHSMIKYCYTAGVNINRDSALPLLRLSSMYQVDSLRDKCMSYLRNNMEFVHCVPLYHMASMQHDPLVADQWESISEQCCDKMQEPDASVLILPNSAVFLGLGVHLLVEILEMIFEDYHVPCAGAVFLGSALTQWGKENWGTHDMFDMIAYIDRQAERLRNTIVVQLSDYSKLRKFCINSIIKDFDIQRNCAGFFKLPHTTVQEILQDDELNVKLEKTVLEALAEWLNANSHIREDDIISKLVSVVRFPFIALNQLIDLPRMYPIIGRCSEFPNLLQEALQFQLYRSTSRKRSAEELEANEAPVKKQRTSERNFYVDVPVGGVDELISCIVSNVSGAH